MIDRLTRAVNRALLTVAGLGVLLLAVVVLSGVISRYLLGAPFSFVTSATEYLLLAVVFLAMAGALQFGAHVRIGFVTEMMPPRVGLIVRQIGDGIGVIASAVLCSLSTAQFFKVLASGETDISILRIPMWAIQWLPMIGFALLTVTYLLLWVQAWKHPNLSDSGSVDPMIDDDEVPA